MRNEFAEKRRFFCEKGYFVSTYEEMKHSSLCIMSGITRVYLAICNAIRLAILVLRLRFWVLRFAEATSPGPAPSRPASVPQRLKIFTFSFGIIRTWMDTADTHGLPPSKKIMFSQEKEKNKPVELSLSIFLPSCVRMLAFPASDENLCFSNWIFFCILYVVLCALQRKEPLERKNIIKKSWIITCANWLVRIHVAFIIYVKCNLWVGWKQMRNTEIIKAEMKEKNKNNYVEKRSEKIANFIPAFPRLLSRVFRRKALYACLIPFEVPRLAGA